VSVKIFDRPDVQEFLSVLSGLDKPGGRPHAFLHRKRTAPGAPRSAYRVIIQGRAGGKDMRS